MTRSTHTNIIFGDSMVLSINVSPLDAAFFPALYANGSLTLDSDEPVVESPIPYIFSLPCVVASTFLHLTIFRRFMTWLKSSFCSCFEYLFSGTRLICYMETFTGTKMTFNSFIETGCSYKFYPTIFTSNNHTNIIGEKQGDVK